MRDNYNGYLRDSALYWMGSSNDSFGQIVLNHEDLLEAARNPRVAVKRAIRHPAALAVTVAILYTLWVNRESART
jgi:hypothetical protein